MKTEAERGNGWVTLEVGGSPVLMAVPYGSPEEELVKIIVSTNEIIMTQNDAAILGYGLLDLAEENY